MTFTNDQKINIRHIIETEIFRYRQIYTVVFDEYMSRPNCSYIQFQVYEIIGSEIKELLYWFDLDKWEISIVGGASNKDNENLVEICIGERI